MKTGERFKTLSTLYKNQRRHCRRKGFDWWNHNNAANIILDTSEVAEGDEGTTQEER